MLQDITTGVKKNKTLYAVLQIAIVVAIVVIVAKVYKAWQQGTQAVGQGLGNDVIAIRLGMQVGRVAFIRQAATDLWKQGVDAKWGWDWLRNYDEELFLSTINSMANVKELALLDQSYREASGGERIKQAINAAFKTSTKAKITPEYLTILMQ